MDYRNELRPWVIFEHLPDGNNKCVARLRTRSDADAYASLLRRGGGSFEVMFDKQPQEILG
ncbi:MAG: hypothetical protein V7K40_07535 [Nostoc sp.]|uniref:hypothetical protein n=1 Tax=Nostoc sp. TaxID=1180 RepID=UPI002FF82ED7